MLIRPEAQSSKSTLKFLKHCYRFVSKEWPHAEREQVPDKGFERRFRESCIQHLQGWSISEERELHLGAGLDTASGVLHEVDIVVRGPRLTAILEMKNRSDWIGKNDVIVFFAKILDYLSANPVLVSEEVCLAFISNGPFESRGLATCLGLGIHPVAPDIRPLPVLVNNAMIMGSELSKGLVVSSNAQYRFDDLCSQINNLSSALSETWLDNRCGYLSETSILIRAVSPPQVDALAQELRQINSDCTDILSVFRAAKAG